MMNVLRIGFAGLGILVLGILTLACAAVIAVLGVLFDYAVRGAAAMILALPLMCAWNLSGLPFPYLSYWEAFGTAFLLILVKDLFQRKTYPIKIVK